MSPQMSTLPSQRLKFRQALWGDVPQTRTERKLLLKIDWFILSYCCLMYFTNYLDRSNISNAYVSGMKEELNMVGTQFNQINTIFTCGYIIGMIPSRYYNLMLQVLPPRIWFPCMHITWGILTFCTSAVTSVPQIFAIRFFQAMAESSTFVGTHYILGSWYKPGELGKRSGIFTSSGLAGTLFSGVLQAAVYRNLNGVAARSGWRWLFIIDGVITLPIALYGFFVFPDTPGNTKAPYLTEEERRLSVARLGAHAPTTHSTLTWGLLGRVVRRWRWYGCSLLFAISGETESFGSNNLMGQWLKASGEYTVEQVDYYPSGMTAFAIASTLVCAAWTDSTRSRARWPVLVYMSLSCVIASICILNWGSPTGLKFFAYYLAGASYAGQATTFAWANQICADDDQERAIVLASMKLAGCFLIPFMDRTLKLDYARYSMWNNVVNAWWPLVFYPATDAPRFVKGMWAMIGVSIATLGVTWLVWHLEGEERQLKQARQNAEDSGQLYHDKAEMGDRVDLEERVGRVTR